MNTCDGCAYYERETDRTFEDAPAGPDSVTWHTHRCWREPVPVVRLLMVRDAEVRACAWREDTR